MGVLRRHLVGGAAAGGLLQRLLPRRRDPHRDHRPRRRPQGRRQRPRPHPPLLPRLLRQGLRRVGAAGRPDGQQHGGEDGPSKLPQPPRLRRHRPRQACGGAPLPGRRLLRRHRRLRRARRRPHHGRHPLRHAVGPPRRPRFQRHRGPEQPAPGLLQPHPARGALRHQEPHRRRHGHPLRRALHRPLPLLLLLVAAVPAARPLHERHARRGAPGPVPRRRRPARPRRGPRLQDAAAAGQPVLPQRGDARGGVHVGPVAHRRQRHGGARRAVRRQPEALVAAVRRRHGQDGEHRGAHRAARGGQATVQQGQLIAIRSKGMNELIVVDCIVHTFRFRGAIDRSIRPSAFILHVYLIVHDMLYDRSFHSALYLDNHHLRARL